MTDLITQILEKPSLYSILIVLLAALLYAFWQVIKKQLNLSNQSYDEIINERAKDLVNSLSTRVNALEEVVERLKNELDKEKEENIRLAMLNALILSSKSMIKGLPHWVFSYPEHRCIYVSEEYVIFLPKGVSVSEYVNEYNTKFWNSEVAAQYNKNNDKAAKNGFWFGFETIIVDDVDMTYDYIIVKIALRDSFHKVDKVLGLALEVSSKSAKHYLNQLIQLTKIPE